MPEGEIWERARKANTERCQIPLEDVKGAFKIICAENRFNPIVDMLEALPAWDGKPRAAFMLWALFGAEDNLYTQQASLTWMRGAVRRAYEPGCKFDYTIVLKGAQGIKKSMTGRRLAMREEFFCETVTDITNAKTTSEQTGGKWIVELGELSGLKGKELEAVKAALTAQKTTVRQAYAHFPIDQPRSCVFLATTNENDFLTDPTGNRRFLPVECAVTDDRKGWDLADVEELRGFIEQAWAEILQQYKEAKKRAETEDEFLRLYPLVLSDEAEALAEEKRDSSSVEDTRIGVIEAWLEEEATWKRRIMATATREKNPQWTAAAWLLERKYPDEYAQTTRRTEVEADEVPKITLGVEVRVAGGDGDGDD